jgi:hypothetical protein
LASSERIVWALSARIDFYDNNDSIATPGGLANLTGYRLKYDTEDDNQGLFFIAEDGTATKGAEYCFQTCI